MSDVAIPAIVPGPFRPLLREAMSINDRNRELREQGKEIPVTADGEALLALRPRTRQHDGSRIIGMAGVPEGAARPRITVAAWTDEGMIAPRMRIVPIDKEAHDYHFPEIGEGNGRQWALLEMADPHAGLAAPGLMAMALKNAIAVVNGRQAVVLFDIRREALGPVRTPQSAAAPKPAATAEAG